MNCNELHSHWATIAAMVLLSRANVAVPKDLNVVLIVADDLGRIDLGCLGASFMKRQKATSWRMME
jgi:hypothetical protein